MGSSNEFAINYGTKAFVSYHFSIFAEFLQNTDVEMIETFLRRYILQKTNVTCFYTWLRWKNVCIHTS